MGRRNTRVKPSILVVGPDGLVGAPQELARQVLPMGERMS